MLYNNHCQRVLVREQLSVAEKSKREIREENAKAGKIDKQKHESMEKQYGGDTETISPGLDFFFFFYWELCGWTPYIT